MTKTIHVQVPAGARKPTMFNSPRTLSVANIFEAMNAQDEHAGSTLLLDGVVLSRDALATVDAAKSSAEARAAAEAFIASI